MNVASDSNDNQFHPSREWLDQQLSDCFGKCTLLCPSPRRVSFATNGQQVAEKVFTFDKPATQFHRDLYWSRQEKATFVIDAMRLAQELRSVDPAHKRRVERAYYNSIKDSLPRDQRIADIQAIISWVNSDGRGLERSIFPILCDEQRSVVRQTVLYHQVLSRIAEKGSAEDSLRTFSENRTSRAREFAVKMAVADAIMLGRSAA